MTSTLRTILAATDFSASALTAVRKAAAIARGQHARLELLHVVSAFATVWASSAPATDSSPPRLEESAEEELTALAAKIGSEFGIKVHGRVVTGEPAAEIAARSEAVNADLIVVGPDGANGLLAPVIGSTAHRLLTRSRRPVLLVKRAPRENADADVAYEHALVATDFSDDAAEAARCVRRLFPDATVTLFHAYEAPFEAKLTRVLSEPELARTRQSAAMIAHTDLALFAESTRQDHAARVVRHGPPSRRIPEYAKEISTDLIVTGSGDMSALRRAVLGSISLDVVTEAPCDVLLARTRRG